MTVAERVREVGLLRAAGTTRRQVNNLVILQAAGLGIVGSVIGVGLGALLSLGMATAVRAIGVVPIGAPVLPVGGAVVALLVGLAVTIAAALEPAVRAGRIPPVEALRSRGEGVAAVRARLRWLIVVFAVVAAAGLAIWPSAAQVGLLRPFVVYLVLLGSTLLLPFVLGPLGRIAGLPFALLLPAEARLTRSSLVRDRSRTALTVGALAVGLAMIVALGSVAQDARRAATAWLVGVVPGDEVATSIRPIAPGEGVREQLVAIPGVARVSPIATFGLAFRGVRIDAAAVVGTDLLADGRLAFTAGDRRNALTALDAGGSAIVPRSVAERLAIQLGDTLDFTVGGGRTKAERVVGIVERGLPGRSGETIFVGWPDALGPFGVLGADAYAIRYAPGAGAGAVDALHALATGLALEPSPLERVSGSISDVLDRVFGLFDALALVAVVVAGLGIVNTLTMNVMERVREIGVLRALGMTRRQVWRMVVVEAAVLGIVGVVVGVAVGIVAGQVLVGLGGNGILQLPLDPPWRTIGLAAAFGFVVAVLAAAVPARAASRISIVRAVQAE
jgi:putative ABC transport system permease protein